MKHHLSRIFNGSGVYAAPLPLDTISSFPIAIDFGGDIGITAVGSTLGAFYTGSAATIAFGGDIGITSVAGNYSTVVYASAAATIDFGGAMAITAAEGVGNRTELVPDSEMNNLSLWTVANSGTGIAYAYTSGGTMTVVGDVGAILTITNNGSVVTGLDYDYELKINSSTFTGLGTSIYIGDTDRIWKANDGAVTIVPTTITNLGAGDSTAGWMQFRGAGTAVIDYLRIQRTVANTDFFFMDPEQVDIDGMSVLSADGAFVTASLLIFEDNFDGTNTDPLDARTTTGAGLADPLTWTDANSTFEIDTNQLRPIGLDGIATLEDHGQANFILKYHINAQQQGAENNISVVARFKNAYRWIAVDHALDSGGNSYLRVNQASASSLGVGELLAESGPGTFDFRQGNGGEWVTIIVLSNTLTVYVDSAPASSTLTVDIDSELDAITVVGVFPPRLNPNQIRINDLQMTIFLGTSFTSDAAQIDIDGLSINSADGTFNTVWPPGFNSLPISIDIDGMSILSADGTFNANPSVALFTEGFESGNFLNPVGGTWTDYSTPGLSVSNLLPKTGTYSARFPFGGRDSFVELRARLNTDYDELWIQQDMYVPGNYAAYNNPASTDNQKLMLIWCGSNTPPLADSGPGVVLSLYPYAASGGTGNSYLDISWYSNANGMDIAKSYGTWIDLAELTGGGKWMTITVRVKLATVANNDGVTQVWRRWENESTATLVVNETALGIYVPGQIGFQNWYHLGWHNAGFLQTTTFYIDNVIVADTALDPDA